MNNIKKLWLTLYPESLVLRKALSTCFAVFVAIIVDRYHSLLHQAWVPVVTILITQLTMRTNLRQALERTFIVFFSILVLSVLVSLLRNSYLTNIVVICGFIISYLFYSGNLRKGQFFPLSLLWVVVILMMLIPFAHPEKIYERMHDVVLGCIISVGVSLLIFPARPDIDFRKGVVPILNAYSRYLLAISSLLFKENDAETMTEQAKVSMENILQVHQPLFPAWVYDLGFNLELQQGHRHFLVKIERLGQILFAMHQVARHPIDVNLLAHFRDPIKHYIEKANVLINLFTVRLELKKVNEGVEDFSEDIQILEDTYRQVINVPLELLDTSQDYIDIAAFIYDLKDFQKILLSLAEALR